MVIISFLPQEIIIDIFTRLPLKSIGRCRCVSNSWRTFLSQGRFTNTNFQQHSLILLSGTGSLFTAPFTVRHTQLTLEPLTKLSFHNYSDSWDNIYAVCGGLVLVENTAGDLFLVNPVTAEIRKVPALPYRPNLRDCYNKYGVGYDSVNDDYKVVVVSYYAPCLAPESEDDDSDDDDDDIYDKCFVNVFSVKNGAWSKAECSPYSLGHDDSPIPGVYVNGFIHWIANGIGTHSAVIASFDLVTETFSIVPAPCSWGESTWSNVVELGGDLCLYQGGSDYWIMKEYGNKDSWIHVKLKAEGEVRPLCMLREKEMVVFVKDEESDDEEAIRFVKYDLDKETWEDISVVDTNSDDFEAKGAFVGTSNGSQGPRFCREAFVETLVSPHSSLE